VVDGNDPFFGLKIAFEAVAVPFLLLGNLISVNFLFYNLIGIIGRVNWLEY